MLHLFQIEGGVSMDFSGLSSIFKFIIIGIIYIIIVVALTIMYKDIKKPNRKKKKVSKKFGLEVIKVGEGSNLKQGSIVPIQEQVTIGRKEDNMIILREAYVSSYHAKIYSRNNACFVQDLQSTNGTIINSKKISGEELLKVGDLIKIGNSVFRIIS